MKNVQYFVNEEEKYLSSPQANPELVWNDEYECFDYPYDPLDFLKRKPFSSFLFVKMDIENIYNLTDVEKLMLACFYGDISAAFRDDYYRGEVPALVGDMQLILNNAIKKAPKFNGKILYRFTKSPDKVDFAIGDIFQVQHNLTTTTEDWEQNRSDVYVITPLPANKTNAHSIYEIYNHGNETQVNFIRGTHFRIDKMESIDGTEYKRIYMSEIEK